MVKKNIKMHFLKKLIYFMEKAIKKKWKLTQWVSAIISAQVKIEMSNLT